MKELLFQSAPMSAALILRLTAGLIMLPHGLQKLVGMFGGFGYRNTMIYFTETMKLPWTIAVSIIWLESLGSVLLAAGFLTRLWAAAFIVLMVGAIITTNGRHGLFMNWFGTQAGEGFEYHVLLIGICLALLITGSGSWSLDRLIVK